MEYNPLMESRIEPETLSDDELLTIVKSIINDLVEDSLDDASVIEELMIRYNIVCRRNADLNSEVRGFER